MVFDKIIRNYFGGNMVLSLSELCLKQLFASQSGFIVKDLSPNEVNRLIDMKIKSLMIKVALEASRRGINLDMIGVNEWAKDSSMTTMVITDEDVKQFYAAPSCCVNDDQFLGARVQITFRQGCEYLLRRLNSYSSGFSPIPTHKKPPKLKLYEFKELEVNFRDVIGEAILNIDYVSVENKGVELSPAYGRSTYSWLNAICHILKDAGIINKIDDNGQKCFIRKE